MPDMREGRPRTHAGRGVAHVPAAPGNRRGLARAPAPGSRHASGSVPGLAQDAAGQQLLDLLRASGAGARRQRTTRSTSREWRRWLDGAARTRDLSRSRRDESRALHSSRGDGAAGVRRRHPARVRRAAVPGRAGRESLFFNQSVRRQLGLPVREDELEQVRRDLIALIATTPQVIRHLAGPGRRRTESRQPVLRAAAGVQQARLRARSSLPCAAHPISCGRAGGERRDAMPRRRESSARRRLRLRSGSA